MILSSLLFIWHTIIFD